MKKIKPTLFLLEDQQEPITDLAYLLKEARLSRYSCALREQTKRKILTGSLFNGFIFHKMLGCSALFQKAFEGSLYPYSGENGLYFSIANSVYSHALLISDKATAVDIEWYRDRNAQIYTAFLNQSTESGQGGKEAFYQNWLKKECLVKYGTADISKEMQYLFFKDYIVGTYLEKNEVVELVEVTMNELVNYYKGGTI